MSTLSEQLRRQIEAKHKEALQALEVLERYFEDGATAQENGDKPKAKRRAGNGSNRDKVLAIVDHEFASVGEISKRTGLDAKQVRGVLNAPGLKGHFDKQEADGELQYRTKGK
jgi:predicted Rossmann fold nucleotide-binding protein DprA/Smf involved in DNA uptake